MPKFTEETLDSWRKPSSENEEQKISNTISMIKEAVSSHSELKNKTIEFVPQGSYRNNTNVRLNSDIDICVMLKDTFFSKYRDGATREDYGFTEGTDKYGNFRQLIINSLISKFGNEAVTVGNKSIKIHSNTYRVEADVVPAFQYRNYRWDTKNDVNNFYEGIKFFSSDGLEIINYPNLQYNNGVKKNDATQRKFKRTVRLFKRIKNRMVEEGLPVPNSIKSFFIECLIYNVPNQFFTTNTSWNDILRDSIIHIHNSTIDLQKCKNLIEVNEMFYLFHSSRKWNIEDTNLFAKQMWKYLQYT